jgi:hypothetical protein
VFDTEGIPIDSTHIFIEEDNAFFLSDTFRLLFNYDIPTGHYNASAIKTGYIKQTKSVTILDEETAMLNFIMLRSINVKETFNERFTVRNFLNSLTHETVIQLPLRYPVVFIFTK